MRCSNLKGETDVAAVFRLDKVPSQCFKKKNLIFKMMLWTQIQIYSRQQHLPDWTFEKLPCVVWLAWAGSLRLSCFMLSKQASALTAACAGGWCRPLLNVRGGPECPDWWEVFSESSPWHFLEPLIESLFLFNISICLEGFAFMFWVFTWTLHRVFSGWTASVRVLDFKTFFGFSVAVLELLCCWDMLKGTGLVYGFFVLAFPCNSIIMR